MKNRAARLTFCIFLISFAVWGQKQERNVSVDTSTVRSDTRVTLQREITLDKDSKSEEVILKIEDDVDRFELIINSKVITGNLKIEVYDPKGNKQGTFSVGTQLNGEKSERVNGKISKSLKHPQSGNWKVNIFPTKATGIITIQIAFW
ncbi:MAG: hypothetical protein ABIR06_11545 [Cyclobacteriaceae bacterium]